ncbi:hypothetical protein PpBr36_00264 [Pyricularia pennisetigena]|uniref:hypothetical protein n=1 Tax=Pyricularia pennisetigena TaxID=1578925 RepID=UPI001150C74C|nr:hypothetical protein PpBr36_00264 [Pyricularia pennisetigena]TLS28578.1 hypothetical protein PpBr36_00264 [Pyricularia pennisetigena]
MSSETLPISPARFAEAIKDLSLASLHLKVLEIRNSIAHLDYSNEQLRPFAEGKEPVHGGDGTAQPDQDCIDAIKENEDVIERMQERIRLVRVEVEENRGCSWTEFESAEERGQRGEQATESTAPGSTGAPTTNNTTTSTIAADTRATSGPIVADKNCEKLHYISPQIWCAGAGTAADTEFTTAIISSQLELHSLSTGRKPRVVTCMTMLKQHLFQYQGHIGAYLVVAGVDPTGTHLFTVHAHGSTDKLPYVTMGSGSLAAMSVFETQWQSKLDEAQAIKLCSDAIQAGIWNDLGSGSNVDVAVITADKTRLLRNYIKPNERSKKLQSYKFARGTTAVLNDKIVKKEELSNFISVSEVPAEGDSMEVDS